MSDPLSIIGREAENVEVTDATAKKVIDLPLPSDAFGGGRIDFMATLTDGSDFVVVQGRSLIVAANDGGALTSNVDTDILQVLTGAGAPATVAWSVALVSSVLEVSVTVTAGAPLTPTDLNVLFWHTMAAYS